MLYLFVACLVLPELEEDVGVEADEDPQRDDEDNEEHGRVVGLHQHAGPTAVAWRALKPQRVIRKH